MLLLEDTSIFILLSSFTGEEFKMQEACELAVVTLLVRYTAVYKQFSQNISKLKDKRELKEESRRQGTSSGNVEN